MWRRLGGALASQARAAGWGAWGTRDGDPPHGTGLRHQTSPSLPDAEHVLGRLSYGAYQRLGALLASAGGVVAARMLLPETKTRNDLRAKLLLVAGPGVLPTALVVFEYALGTGAAVPWAYLALVDPSSAVRSVEVAVRPAGTPYATVRQWGLDLAGGFSFYAYSTLGRLPPQEYQGGGSADLDLPAVLEVRRGEYPVLLHSDHQLEWSAVGALDGFLEEELVRPAEAFELEWVKDAVEAYCRKLEVLASPPAG